MPVSSQLGPLTHPSYDKDLFAPEALRNPLEHYRAIRNLGAVVWLSKADVYALGRFVNVRNALRMSDVLVSGRGVGFNKLVNAPTEHPPIIQRDGESHRKLRKVLVPPLMPAALRGHREMLKDMISARIDALVGTGEFDAIPAIAQHLPLQAIAYLVGLSAADREQMLAWATAAANAIGPLALDGSDDPALIAEVEMQAAVRRYVLEIDLRSLRSGSWAAGLFTAVENGDLDLQDARAALAGLVFPSLDTTINAKGSLLYNLAMNPAQWQQLREDPRLIPSAVQENMRFSPAIRWFSRVASEDYLDADVRIPAGARVMLLYGSANRDERHYRNADQFDVTRNPTDHLGFGAGPHMCAGASLAKLEMEVMLEALVERVSEIQVGTPVPGSNRGLYGFQSLPLQLR